MNNVQLEGWQDLHSNSGLMQSPQCLSTLSPSLRCNLVLRVIVLNELMQVKCLVSSNCFFLSCLHLCLSMKQDFLTFQSRVLSCCIFLCACPCKRAYESLNFGSFLNCFGSKIFCYSFDYDFFTITVNLSGTL